MILVPQWGQSKTLLLIDHLDPPALSRSLLLGCLWHPESRKHLEKKVTGQHQFNHELVKQPLDNQGCAVPSQSSVWKKLPEFVSLLIGDSGSVALELSGV